MKLWTWQKPDLDITNPSHKVDSLNNSQYFKVDKYNDLESIERHKQAYQNIWEKYQTDQILWCYSSFETATSYDALDYKDKILWELDISNSFIVDAICGIAWEWIIFNRSRAYPNCFENLFRHLKGHLANNGIPYHSDDICKDFNRYWSNLNTKELHETLSVDPNRCQTGCPTIIIKHPIDEQWVISQKPHNQVLNQRKK